MVALALAVLPLLLGGGIYVTQLLIAPRAVSELSFSAAAHAVLVACAIAACALAALKRRRGLVPWAWTALLAGVVLFSAGELLELVTRAEEGWAEQLLRMASFLPLAVFVWQVASPLTIVFASRRRLTGTVVIALAFLLAVAAIELPPLLAGAGGAAEGARLARSFAAARPFLDALLFVPLAVSLSLAGLRHRGEPYLFIGLGILAELVADIIFHYELLTDAPGLEELAFLFAGASLVYITIGSLWSALGRETAQAGPASGE